MKFVWTIFCNVLAAIFMAFVHLANMFICDIIIFESTENMTFDWYSLLKNKLFWILSAVLLLYYLISYIKRKDSSEVDEELEKAISEQSVRLVNIITDRAGEGDYTSCKEVFKVLDKMQKRRRK